MLDNIIKLVKGPVMDAISGNNQIPEEKKDAAVETTTTTIVDKLKDQLIPDNLSEVVNMFGGGGKSAIGGSVMTQTIQAAVASALTSKVGLNAGIANTIANTVVPTVMKLFSDKVNDKNEPGFNIESIIKAFSGNKDNNSGGGLMGMLGGLLGGNK